MVSTRRQSGKTNSTLSKKTTPKKAASKTSKKTNEDWIMKTNTAFANFNDFPNQYKQASKHTRRHENSRAELCEDFFTHIVEKQAPILGVFYGERVYHQGYLGWVPNLILMLAGVNPSLALRTLASSILCPWVLDARKKCGNYYQPNLQMTHLRTFLGALRDIFGWNYNINRDFNFVGGLTAIFDKMVMDCRKEIGGRSAS